MEDEEHSGWGIGSTVILLIIACVLFLAPLEMGPLQPPSTLSLLFFPVILLGILYFLHQASNEE
ncbi:uncharacterized protein LOC122724423 [Manihot esculenta]|uniref:Uncharacterized protein n=1 Tax=Manihot esculenta TaxID=3983 RepID=A0A2C9VFM9_MANES|nr:uncharacterized protein LOC122724423 [Manihot esculenta]